MKISGWSLIRLFTLFVYISMFAPIVVVIILSFNPMEFASFPMEGFSFRWYIRLAQNQSTVTAFQTSLFLGSITAVISTAIAIPAAMAFVRYDFPGKNTLNTLLLTPIMIPEVILGVAPLLYVVPVDTFTLSVGIIETPHVYSVPARHPQYDQLRIQPTLRARAASQTPKFGRVPQSRFY